MIKQNSKTQNKTIDAEKFHASEEAQNDFQSCVDSITAESKQVMTDKSKF